MEERGHTMSKIRLLLVAAVIFGSSAAMLRAEPPQGGEAEVANLDALLNAIRSNRKALVAVNLQVTDDEAVRFWPIYDRYQKEVNALGDRLVGVIQDYAAHFSDLSDAKATALIEEYLAIEADRVKVRRSYLGEFGKSLPGRKVARFYQIENKMDAVIRYGLASTIPVIDEERGAPAK
jgi:hypothetical protein